MSVTAVTGDNPVGRADVAVVKVGMVLGACGVPAGAFVMKVGAAATANANGTVNGSFSKRSGVLNRIVGMDKANYGGSFGSCAPHRFNRAWRRIPGGRARFPHVHANRAWNYAAIRRCLKHGAV